MADYTRWYRVGTVALTKGSKTVTGSGTYWLAASLNPGDMFSTDDVTEYEIDTITSNTQLTLKTAYSGDSTTETAYRIIRNFTAQLPAQVAAQTADLLNDFRRYVDADMQSIHGKSAYQIACDKGYTGTESEWIQSLKGDSAYTVAVSNGYTGTQAEWLESLKAAGEWTTVQETLSDTEKLTASLGITDPANIKNLIYSGKNLGEFSQDYMTVIRNGTFTGLGLGDYFTHNGKKYVIAGFNSWWSDGTGGEATLTKPHMILWRKDALTWEEFDFTLKPTGYHQMTFNCDAVGEEEQEGYIPSTRGKPYATSFWYTYARPKFITLLESIFGASNLKQFTIDAPTKNSNATDAGVVRLKSVTHLLTSGMVFGWNMIHPRFRDGRSNGGSGYGEQFFDILPLFRQTPKAGLVGNGTMCALADVSVEAGGNLQVLTPFGTTSSMYWPDNYWTNFLRPVFVLA